VRSRPATAALVGKEQKTVPAANRKQMEMRGSYNFLNGQKVKANPEEIEKEMQNRSNGAELFSANTQWTSTTQRPKRGHTEPNDPYFMKQEDMRSSWLDNTASTIFVKLKNIYKKLLFFGI
jgi:hypothetical protein